MDNLKGHMKKEKCPTFYKEQIKNQVKASKFREIINSIKSFFQNK